MNGSFTNRGYGLQNVVEFEYVLWYNEKSEKQSE